MTWDKEPTSGGVAVAGCVPNARYIPSMEVHQTFEIERAADRLRLTDFSQELAKHPTLSPVLSAELRDGPKKANGWPNGSWLKFSAPHGSFEKLIDSIGVCLEKFGLYSCFEDQLRAAK